MRRPAHYSPPAVVPWFICRAHAAHFLNLVRAELRRLPRRPVTLLRYPATRMTYRVERGPGREIRIFDRRTGALILQTTGPADSLRAQYRHSRPGTLDRA